MKHVIADVETDDLLEKLTVVHSLVIRDLDSDAVVSCADQPGYTPIAEGLDILRAAEKVYGHNIVKFDSPALTKVYPNFALDRPKVRDTQVIAQMRWAHIKDTDYAARVKQGEMPAHLAGSHALEAWGYRLGVRKTDYRDWCKANGIEKPFEKWRPEMQAYCVDDTATTKALVLHIQKFAPSKESIDIEHELAWYLAAQERCGIPFDMDKAVALQAVLVSRREEIGNRMREEFGPLCRKDGPEFTPKKDDAKKGYVAGCPMQKVKFVEFNPGSRAHIAEKLTRLYGWKPSEFTASGEVEVSEKTLGGINIEAPAVKSLMEYLMIQKRLGSLVEGKGSWMQYARNDGPDGGKITGLFHIHGRVKQNEAITHRASHSQPNVSGVVAVGNPYGQECRELFRVPELRGVPDEEQWVMVGTDASSLEARCLAHRMARFDNGAYGELLLKGDVHTANRIALGLPGDTPEIARVARAGAKTWLYATLYGGGDEKCGSILANIALPDGTRLIAMPKSGWTAQALKKLGADKRVEFLRNTPAMRFLLDEVKAKVKDPGYLIMPDKRRTYIRSEHAALNSLLQSDGAILVKKWIANVSPILHKELGEPGWRGQWVPLLWVHDELEQGVRRKHVPWVQELLVSEMRKLTDTYGWRVPLDAESKSGLTWASVH